MAKTYELTYNTQNVA